MTPDLRDVSALARALDVRSPALVAFTGSGGKTTCAETLAREASAAGLPVVLTTTTKMRVPAHCLWAESADEVRAALATATEPVILGRVAEDGRKLLGPPPALLDALALDGLIAVEADGSRGASVKAYRDGEPVVPASTMASVVMVGVDAVGAGCASPLVHRGERLWPFLGLAADAVLSADDVARAVFTQPGYLDRLHGRVAVLLNKVDDGAAIRSGRTLRSAFAPFLASSPVERLLWRGSAVDGQVSVLWRRGMPRVGGILLAAGASTRFGSPKQLADHGGVPLVAHALRSFADSLLDEEVLVVGHERERVVEAALAAFPHGRLRIAHNAEHASGMASSIRAGLAALSARCDGLLIALADMPGVGPALVSRVVAAAHEQPQAIVVPVTGGRRGHPVYFPRRFFAELEALRGDVGGAGVLRAHPEAVVELDVGDEAIFTDLDVPAGRAEQGHPG